MLQFFVDTQKKITPTIFIQKFQGAGHSEIPPQHLELLLLLERHVVGIPPCVATANKTHRFLCCPFKRKKTHNVQCWEYLTRCAETLLFQEEHKGYFGTSGTAATWHHFFEGWTTKKKTPLTEVASAAVPYFPVSSTEFRTLICWCLARCFFFEINSGFQWRLVTWSWSFHRSMNPSTFSTLSPAWLSCCTLSPCWKNRTLPKESPVFHKHPPTVFIMCVIICICHVSIKYTYHIHLRVHIDT